MWWMWFRCVVTVWITQVTLFSSFQICSYKCMIITTNMLWCVCILWRYRRVTRLSITSNSISSCFWWQPIVSLQLSPYSTYLWWWPIALHFNFNHIHWSLDQLFCILTFMIITWPIALQIHQISSGWSHLVTFTLSTRLFDDDDDDDDDDGDDLMFMMMMMMMMMMMKRQVALESIFLHNPTASLVILLRWDSSQIKKHQNNLPWNRALWDFLYVIFTLLKGGNGE